MLSVISHTAFVGVITLEQLGVCLSGSHCSAALCCLGDTCLSLNRSTAALAPSVVCQHGFHGPVSSALVLEVEVNLTPSRMLPFG